MDTNKTITDDEMQQNDIIEDTEVLQIGCGTIDKEYDSNVLISIIMPVYNNQISDLDRSIGSIVSQKGKFELIIIDDGSRSEIADHLDSFAISDPRISVFHQANSGVSSARNCGIEKAQGEYLTFIDADDLFASEYLCTAQKIVANSGSDVIFFGMRKIYRDGSLYDNTQKFSDSLWKKIDGQDLEILRIAVFDGSILKKIGMKNARYYSTCGTLYKRTVLTGIRFDSSITICEDSCFNWRVLGQAESAVIVGKTGYYYVENGLSATLKPRPNILREMVPTIRAFSEIRECTTEEHRSYIDNGIYFYCFYRIFACSILCAQYSSYFHLSKRGFVKKVISLQPYKEMLSQLKPSERNAHIMVTLAKHNMPLVMTFLSTKGSTLSKLLKRLSVRG